MHAKNEKNRDYYVRHIYYATHSSFIFQAFLHFTMSRIGIMRDIIGGFGDYIRVFFVLLNGKAVI